MAKKKPSFITASGKRKSAVATAKLEKGTGKVLVNGTPLESYFIFSSFKNYFVDWK